MSSEPVKQALELAEEHRAYRGMMASDSAILAPLLADIAEAIREQNTLLAQATHPNRCPCEACRGKP